MVEAAKPGPRVTCLITVYNEEEHIADAVRSVLDQTLSDLELLVIDDGCTDGTPQILAEFDDPRLRVVADGRRGRAGALAYGVEIARGEFIAILDADDMARPERFARQVAFFDANPDTAWIGSGEIRFDTQRGENAERTYPITDTDVRRMSARCIPYSHSAVTFRRSVFTQDGLNYDPEVPYLIDFEFFLRVAERHKVGNLPEMLAMRRLRDESFFQSRFKRADQNRALAKLNRSAVRRFGLPFHHQAYPLARLFYLRLPNGAKRLARRALGLREEFGQG